MQKQYIEFKIEHQQIVRTDDFFVVDGTKNYLHARFNLCNDWKGEQIVAVFTAGDIRKKMEVVDGECCVPWEVLQTGISKFYVGCFAGARITSNAARVDVNPSCVGDADESLPPSPDVYDKILAASNEAVMTAKSIREDAENGKFTGPPGPPGNKGNDGLTPFVNENGNWQIGDADTGVNATGVKGEDGHTPIKGLDYFTEAEKAAMENNVKNSIAIPDRLPADGGNADTVGGKTAEKITTEAVEVFAVTPQMFGAAGDGVTDDTAAFQAALNASTSVFVPAGEYIITKMLRVRQNGTMYGAGPLSVLICKDSASGGGAIGLSAFATARMFAISVQGGSGDLIRVNEDTLRDATGLKSGDVAINIEDLLITYQDDGDSSKRAAISLTLCDTYGDSKRRGYHGVSIRNVHVFGNRTGFFLKGYTAGTEVMDGVEKPKYWITGVTVERCFATGCRWGIFMHKSDSDYSDLAQTFGIDHLSAIRVQHQCDENTRGFFFLRKETNAQFTNCVPWDWHYAQGDYASRPFWFTRDRLEQSSAKVEIAGYSVDGTKIGFLSSDGSTRLLGYPDQYVLNRNIGAREVLIDALPKQMALGDDTIKATCIFRSSDPKIMADGAYLYLHFKFVDSHYMAEDVTVFLHPKEPYIVAGRWNTKHKLGYTITEDGEFRLYVYSERRKVYSFVGSAPISNNITVYDGSAACTGYHKTVNTFDLPYDERYLSEVPDGIVEITRVDVTYAAANHTHEYDDLNGLPEIPTSLPADGGNADTVGGKRPEDFADANHAHNYDEVHGAPKIPTSASDIGARPDTWMPTASEVGADPVGTAKETVAEHNTAEDAHSDLRLQVKGLADRLNAVANSDDTTLDQLSELVAYIKDNRSLIDGITTGKVSVTDIVDNLTTNVGNRPLSASQGVALKALIDAITVPTKVSELTNDSGYLTSAPVASVNGKIGAVQLDAADVGALPASTVIPAIPERLPADGGNADTLDGKHASEFAEKVHGHSFNDLTDKPTIPAAYTHPASHPASMITGLATVATSGSYNDLKNQPNIPQKATDIGAVPDTDILTMVGVDADGNTHTWTIYGKAVT